MTRPGIEPRPTGPLATLYSLGVELIMSEQKTTLQSLRNQGRKKSNYWSLFQRITSQLKELNCAVVKLVSDKKKTSPNESEHKSKTWIENQDRKGYKEVASTSETTNENKTHRNPMKWKDPQKTTAYDRRETQKMREYG